MNENELLIGKKSILKTTFVVFAGAVALGMFIGKDDFNELLFAIAFFSLGLANIATINIQVIISLRERFPQWNSECFAQTKGLGMTLTAAQKNALIKYMEEDEQADQLKREYALARKITILLLVITVIVPVAALVII